MGVIKLTDRIKVMERKPMSFMERIYLPAILKGMGITMSHFFKRRLPFPIQRSSGRCPKCFADCMYCGAMKRARSDALPAVCVRWPALRKPLR